MKKKVTWLIVSCVMAAALLLTSCGSAVEEEITPAAEEEAKSPSVQEIVNGVIQSIYRMDTYQFDMDWTMSFAGEVEGEAIEMSMIVDSNGTFDISNRRARMEMIMSVTIPEEGKNDIGMETYLIWNTSYVLTEIPEMEPVWMKTRMPIGTWKDMTQVEPQVELLESAEVELIGSEPVRGVDCYVLQVTPDLQQLWQIANQQQEIAGGEPLDTTEELIQEMFRDFSVKQWIEKDTYFLTKAEIDMNVEMTPEIIGYPEEEGIITMDMAIRLLAYNYNKPISIVLPLEAEEALEVTPWQTEAAETEFANIQAAVHSMMVDNGLATLPNPVGVATSDMNAFPDATSAVTADKLNDPSGTAYAVGDLDGFLLYQHDITADGAGGSLVNYIATRYTTGTYTVDSMGTVTQVTTGYE